MSKIWLVGTGAMAVEYARALKSLKTEFIAIGRSDARTESFSQETGNKAISGGIEKFLATNPAVPEFAIIAVNVNSLSDTCIRLLEYGLKNILLEKPGVGYAQEIDLLLTKVTEHQANVVLAYNRRFYASVLKAQEIILEDGGVKSFHFEFTEWSHQIRNLKRPKEELENWFLANSTHVIDTAFYLCGSPREISCYHSGGNDWHPKSTIFTGAGISENNALFSYDANWEAPGRWNIDIMTSRHRLIFKPMEKLQIQLIGSVAVSFAENIDYSLDENYKPGLFLQTRAFLNKDFTVFCKVEQQTQNLVVYKKMSGY